MNLIPFRVSILLLFLLLSISAFSQPIRQDAQQFVKPLFSQQGSGAQAAVEEIFPGLATPLPSPTNVLNEGDSLSMYYFRPPLRVQDVLSEFFGGILLAMGGSAAVALVSTGVALLLEAVGLNIWTGTWAVAGAYIGGVLGVPVGIWWGGSNYYSRGNFWITLGSFFAGMLASFLVGYLGQDLGIFLTALVVLPYAGGMLGFNYSRKWRVTEEQFYEEFETGEEELYYDYLHKPPTLPNRVPRIPGPQLRIFRLWF